MMKLGYISLDSINDEMIVECVEGDDIIEFVEEKLKLFNYIQKRILLRI